MNFSEFALALLPILKNKKSRGDYTRDILAAIVKPNSKATEILYGYTGTTYRAFLNADRPINPVVEQIATEIDFNYFVAYLNNFDDAVVENIGRALEASYPELKTADSNELSELISEIYQDILLTPEQEKTAITDESNDRIDNVVFNAFNNTIQKADNVTINMTSPSNKMSDDLSKEFYNLFVIFGEDFKKGTFTVSKSRFYVLPELEDIFPNPPTYQTLKQVKTIPSIFAAENHDLKKTDLEQVAYIGKVTSAKTNPTNFKEFLISFELTGSIPQQPLNEKGEVLGISNLGFGTLNHTHWEILQVDLFAELRNLNIDISELSER